ncbi:HAD family hydrolase [Holdemanella porci]|nr:HAD-IIB family hydrolase [Holdemanella porci]
MNKLQLLITDIDGTLLNTQKQISKQTLDYLIHLQQNNVVIALCSGRIPAELQSLVNQLQLDKYGGYIIHTNGAGIINCKMMLVYL